MQKQLVRIPTSFGQAKSRSWYEYKANIKTLGDSHSCTPYRVHELKCTEK